MMEGLDEIFAATAALGLPWMVGGSVASMVHGEPRATLDVDLIIDLRPGQGARVLAAYPAERFYRPPREAIEHAIGRGARGSFNIIHEDSGMKADVYPAGDAPSSAGAWKGGPCTPSPAMPCPSRRPRTSRR